MPTRQTAPHLALLPLYLELYDRVIPHALARQERLLAELAARLASSGLEVTTLPVCRRAEQVAEAVARAESVRADGVVTLHLAYSPSLEAAPALTETRLPVLMLDTTPGVRFDLNASVDDVLANHGIHGVQDLANVLRRRGKAYWVAAGPAEDPALLHTVREWASAAQAARLLRRTRVARIGPAFAGMGDFDVSPHFLHDVVGPETVEIGVEEVGRQTQRVTAEEVAAEGAADRAAFDCQAGSEASQDRSNRTGIGLRRALEEAGATAFSMNFAAFDRAFGVETVPFLEASKAMERGLGYAGEGDVLTASLVRALNACYGPTTFTEMFCPDWEGGRVFMSHMGECNPELAVGRPLLQEKQYAYSPVESPAVLVFPLQPGPAALVNLAPTGERAVTLIVAEVSIEEMGLAPALRDSPHFWLRPAAPSLAHFLARYSEEGGTHHLALTPGATIAGLRPLAEMMGWGFRVV